jgi:hypothetical protein
MSMTYALLFFLSQLPVQAPTLLAYVVGMVLALVFWRRCPRPAKFTFLAMMLLLITALVHSLLLSFFMQGREDLGWSHETLGLILLITGLIASLIRAAAFGLILAAVFMGRKTAAESHPKQVQLLTEPASLQSEEHRFSSRPGN